MTTRIKLRRDDTTNWEALNPVLALGEPGYNTTENKIKIGDGVTAWTDLAYLTDATGTTFTLTPATTNALGGVKLGEGFVLNGSNQVTTSKLYSTNESDPNVHYRLTLDNNGVVVLPDQSIINGSTMRGVYGTGDLNYTGITIGPDSNHQEESWVWVDASGAHVAARYSGDISAAKQWDFKNDGNLQLPAGGYIVNSNGDDILAGLGGGGGNANTGDFVFDTNAAYIANLDEPMYLQVEMTSGGKSSLSLEASDLSNTRLQGVYNVDITSNHAGISNTWTFGTDGWLSFPGTFPSGAIGYDTDTGTLQLARRDGVSINTQGGSWVFNTDGKLFVPDNGIHFNDNSFLASRDEEGVILWQNDNQENNNNEYVGMWYGGEIYDGDSPNVSITAGSYNWATDDGSRYLNGGEGGTLQYTNYENTFADQGPRQINLDIVTQDGGAILNWHFDESGNLYLPADPGVVGTSGIVFGDGTVQTTAASGTGGGARDITLSQLSTLADTEAGVELTVNRASPDWYTVYGDLDNQSSSNSTIAGSAIHDAGGNVYVLGSISSGGPGDNNNVFLKYNTEGVLQWSRTWTDPDGMNCGSFNTSARYQPELPGMFSDLIYWSSYEPWQGHSYIGTMDTEGVLVNGEGLLRAPVQMANVRIADLEIKDGLGNVYVVGSRVDWNAGTQTPFIAVANLATYTSNVAITVSPPNININNTNAYANFFKSVVTVADYALAVGTYDNGTAEEFQPILTKHIDGGATTTYHLTTNAPGENYYSEAIAYDTVNEAAYVVLNNTTSELFGFVGRLSSDLSEYTWQRRLGLGVGGVYLYGMTFDAVGDIYILGWLPDYDGSDFLLVKMDSDANVLWQRKIGSSAFEGTGEFAFIAPGFSSSADISVHGDHVVFTGVSCHLNAGQPNTFTISYPTDGSLTGDFGDYHAVEFDCGVVTDYNLGINNITGGTIVTEIDGNAGYRADVTEASLTATTKTLDSGFTEYHWDMTNNHLYIPAQTWTFGTDGKFYVPTDGGIHFPSGASITEHTETVVVNNTRTTRQDVIIDVERDLVINVSEDTYQFKFRNNSGLQFPDGTTQYGAYIDQELALDGGSAASQFPGSITNPRLADGGGSASRFGEFDPNYDGSNNGAYTNPNDYTLLLNGGGA